MATQIYKGFEGNVYLGETTTTDHTNIPADSGLSLTAPAAANKVGKVSNFTLRLENNLEAYFSAGSRDATDIKEGNRAISGTLESAIINGALFAAALGKDDGATPFAITTGDNDLLTTFELELFLNQGTNYVAIWVDTVKFDTWETTVTNQGDTVMENQDWLGIFNQAQYVGVPASGI